ncbi:MAG TPA: DNA polymerase III subunit delta [bacterium]|jgi:DNA polymerase III delta subunit
MTATEFLRDVRKGKHFEIVVLRGSEEFLLREAQEEYLSKIVTPDAAAFDFTEFRGSDADGGTLWNAVTTLPLLSERRVVLWESSGEIKQDVADALTRYAARPSATTTLIVVLGGDSRETRLAGLLASSHVTDVEFRDLREGDRAAWAEKFVQRQGKKIEEDALRYVVETSLKNLSDLAAKLNHAILYVGEEKEISVQVLMKVSGVSSEYTVYNLEDALMARRPEQAHRIARSLLDGGEALLRLVAFHRGMVLKLWQVKGILKKPSTWERTEEARQAYDAIFGRQIFKKDAYRQTAQKLDEPRIRQAITGLLDVEVRAKSESQDPYYYFEWLWRFAA